MPSGEYAESRPFKIFISLLDKWEIGAILTETIVYDAFKAVMNLVRNPTENGQDVGTNFHLSLGNTFVDLAYS